MADCFIFSFKPHITGARKDSYLAIDLKDNFEPLRYMLSKDQEIVYQGPGSGIETNVLREVIRLISKLSQEEDYRSEFPKFLAIVKDIRAVLHDRSVVIDLVNSDVENLPGLDAEHEKRLGSTLYK